MNARPNEKSRDCNRGICTKDSDSQAPIHSNNTTLAPTKLLIMLSLLQHFLEVAYDYTYESNNPAWGVLQAAEDVNAAHDELTFALECGGMS
jgi:hypothetical protein